MKPIKLVIWDLDDTFWGGTLSEGAVKMRERNQHIVRELSRRGIVNSICSKNDREQALAALSSIEMNEFFVFARIGWQPKGRVIKALIDDMRLRAENVLFVDDNPLNLREAKHYVPAIQVADPSILDGLLDLEAVRGKADPGLSRLAHYKILEQKAVERGASSVSNEEFLRQCGIVVQVGKDCVRHKGRILELINRTNQLNFTKVRIDEVELEWLLRNREADQGYIVVSDRYGDYGISGFYCFRAGRLEHFVFSCRIMDMGVEQWLFELLGRPELHLRGDVASSLARGPVDWIAMGEPLDAQSERSAPRARVLLKGGCDLEQTAVHLGDSFVVDCEFSHLSTQGMPVHSEHTEILRRSEPWTVAEFGGVIERLAFLDKRAFETRLFSADAGVVVYSTLMDLTQGLYGYEDSGFIVPFGDLLVDLTDERHWPRYLRRFGTNGITREFLRWFAGRFRFLGGLDGPALERNLAWLREAVPAHVPLILINAAEVDKEHAFEVDRWQHHRAMNKVIDHFVGETKDVYLCDVRKCVSVEDDVLDNIRHYSRRAYMRIGREMRAVLKEAQGG